MDTIKRAIEALGLSVASINPVKDSYSSTVRILDLENGQRVVLKIPFTKEKLIREERALKLLVGNPLVPEILDIWYGDDHVVGALLLSYIDGQPMVLPVDDALIYDMGRKLAMIHQVELDAFELSEHERDWSASVKSKIKSWISEIETSLPATLVVDIQAYIDGQITKLNKGGQPCLIHFDYRPGNILINDGKIVGIIDFENSRGGLAAIDFTKISNLFWNTYPNSKSLFLDGYKSIRKLPELETELPIYRFYHAVGGIAWCIRRGRVQDTFFDENMAILQSILRDYAE